MRRVWVRVREAWGRRWGVRRERIVERLERLEERLKELEEEMGAADVVTTTDGEDVWSGAGQEPRRLDETNEELAKANGRGLTSNDDDDNGCGRDARGPSNDVRPGVPQGMAGQQARHGVARFWEGVL